MSDPTAVLIHGAFADASSWRGLYVALAGDGLDVRAPANPLRGVTAGDAAYTQSVLAAIDGPVVLVGHSYGGAVITAAGLSDNVVGLVYVAGFAPDEGEDLGQLLSNFPAAVADQYMRPSCSSTQAGSMRPSARISRLIRPASWLSRSARCPLLPWARRAGRLLGGASRHGQSYRRLTARSTQTCIGSRTTGWGRRSPSSRGPRTW